jgi:hypothetical protein
MKDYSKSSSSGKPAVRQVKGPGMNLGLKKRHKQAKPKPFSDPTKKKGSKKKKGASGPSFLTKGFF